jgi:hypothetical protein
MLWYSNVLAKSSGRKPAPPAWGEEFVDQSLATAWYSTDWSSVGDDELAYLLPSLRRRHAAVRGDTKETQAGPASYLARTLLARAQSAAREVAHVAGEKTTRDVLEQFVASGLITALAPTALLEEPGAVHAEPQASPHAPRSSDWLVAELTALAYADRMLRDATETSGARTEASPLVDWPLSLADVFAATVATRLNGAYVYPQYDWAHEVLSLAAVMGHLLQGRTVYFPPFLARALTDIVSGQRRGAQDDLVAAFRTYADLAGGAALLTGKARIIAALGIARRVSPRPAASARDASRWTWNARLLQRLDEHRCWPIPREA